LATRLALQRGFAINIGGGFHHASGRNGGGFCIYADITLAIKFLLLQNLIGSAMIVDLDAHQGNGHEHDFLNDQRVYIFDMFNYSIYPGDFKAKGRISVINFKQRISEAIRKAVRLKSYTQDEEYMSLLRTNLRRALDEFTPDLIVYNAGTDVLDGDPLGCLSITSKVKVILNFKT
jgi:histone deacetylase 11